MLTRIIALLPCMQAYASKRLLKDREPIDPKALQTYASASKAKRKHQRLQIMI